VAGLAYAVGIDAMELVKTKDLDELLFMQAALEEAEKVIRKRDEDQANRIAHGIWSTMPKFG